MIAKEVTINRFCAPNDVLATSSWKKYKVGEKLFSTKHGAVVEITEVVKEELESAGGGYNLYRQKVVDCISRHEDNNTLSTVFTLNKCNDDYVVIKHEKVVLDNQWFEEVFNFIAKYYPDAHFVEDLLTEAEYIEIEKRTAEGLIELDKSYSRVPEV